MSRSRTQSPELLPFAVSSIGEEEIREVAATLRSGWLATGPRTAEFERRFADYVGCRHAVGVTSGTVALRLALEVAGIEPGDEVITASLTYVASAHEIVHRGAVPIFADIDPRTWNLDPTDVERRIGPRTRAILLTHFAGRPCSMDRFEALADRHGLQLISDAAHAIETRVDDAHLAPRSAISAYSFHPIKNLTTGEGGMVVTDDEAWADELRLRRAHGIDRDAWSRRDDDRAADWDVRLLGHKGNMSDIQASIGLHQLARLEAGQLRRHEIAARYLAELEGIDGIRLPGPVDGGTRHAWHLFTVVLDPVEPRLDRVRFRDRLRAEGIGTGHHYPAIHRLSYYRERYPVPADDLPHSERVGARIVTLPLYPSMTDDQVDSVVGAVRRVMSAAG